MRRNRMGTVLVLLVFLTAGCAASSPRVTSVQTSSESVQEKARYQGPRARLAVAEFECESKNCSRKMGRSLATMLTTSLARSSRFVVLEREQLEAIKKEIQLGESDWSRKDQPPPRGLLEGADILIKGSVTGFRSSAHGGEEAGGVILPRSIPWIGGARIERENAWIQVDLRLVDVRTGRIVNATRVEGTAQDFEVDGLGGAIVDDLILVGYFERFDNTPFEKALAVLIDRGVQEIVRLTPESYYREQGSSG